MARSLNQAFIKAYNKASSTGDSESVLSDDGYIVRVDTATVSIPEPHYTRQKPATKPMVTSPAPESGYQAEALEAAEESTELRASIADQMVRASSWKDSSIDAFIGGFPMVNDDVIDETEEQSPSTPTRRDSDEATIDASVQSDIEAAAQARSTQVNTAADSYEQETQSAAVQVEAAQVEAAQVEASSTSINETTATTETSTDTSALSNEQVDEIVRNYVQKHGNSGEILRLDRPSDEAAGGDTIGVLESAFAETDAEEDSSLAEDDEAYETVDDEHDDAAVKIAREREETLRNARGRNFQPVWEVDCLQWPAVCMELLQQREENLMRVASNLSKACNDGLQVLAVTSPQRGEGRTTVACCLAKLAGINGLRVAFVDGDLENPSLTHQTNLDVEMDWKSAVMNQIPIEEVAIHSIDDQVTLIPLTKPVAEDEFATDDNRIAFMVHELADSFDLVIIDMGHMESTRTLLTSLAEQGIVNAVVTVVDTRIAATQRLEACLRRIRRTGVSSVGLVENFGA